MRGAAAGTLAHERLEVEDSVAATIRFASGVGLRIGLAPALWGWPVRG